MKTLWCVMLSFVGITMAAIANDEAAPAAAAPAATEEKAAAPEKAAKACFVCEKCQVMSCTAGKCAKCDMELTKTHVLQIKDGVAYCCGCGADCACKPADDNTAKCSCGKDVKKISLKGMYTCTEGKCQGISDKPGTCKCGKEFKKVE